MLVFAGFRYLYEMHVFRLESVGLHTKFGRGCRQMQISETWTECFVALHDIKL